MRKTLKTGSFGYVESLGTLLKLTAVKIFDDQRRMRSTCYTVRWEIRIDFGIVGITWKLGTAEFTGTLKIQQTHGTSAYCTVKNILSISTVNFYL